MTEKHVHTNICMWLYTVALFTIAQRVEHIPTDNQINKMWYMHTKEDYSATKTGVLIQAIT